MNRIAASRVRREFLDYFVERGHREVPSAPVFPKDDPTLLFTNAGMNQFKDVFLGTGKREYKRAVDTQKCIRVSGKHNDLEEVGRDGYHHTFFEMLGNWSFGDYFKADAIVWGWELLTGVWKLPKERLWATVFAGDATDGLEADEEAAEIWRSRTDIDPAHILRCKKKDNFWEMGATGPCGPCSEIHIDRGEPGSDPRDGANPKIGVNAGNERFMELWNLVFMQFNRMDDGKLAPLPARSVDTGMGFERVLSVMQQKSSNYDTDLFAPIFEQIAAQSSQRYRGGMSEIDIAFRVCADHMRAVTAAIADGALPSNEGRGYVLRRLIRRASRFARQALGREEPFLWHLVEPVAGALGAAFPEIPRRADLVRELVRSEEEAFGRTLDRGLVLFADFAKKLEKTGGKVLPGKDAYELYATYGFPQDLVDLMARERGLSVDLEGWQAAEEAHRAVSRSEGRFAQLLSAEQLAGLPATQSTYYESDASALETHSRVLRHVAGEDGADRLVLDQSPFYPEGGGQIGDQGVVEAADGSFRFHVSDARKLGEVVVHVGRTEGVARVGGEVVARVDGELRSATRANHTATHLLHQALRMVLGEHVTQQGSYVGPDRLRFDLSHPRALTSEEIERIETLVNGRVLENHPVATTVEEPERAKARGVMALFGEKYGDRVRVVDVGGWSKELCGGTHVRAAGDIGPFVILSERAIQAGVRRIEALTGRGALAWMREQRRLLAEAAQALKAKPEEVPERIEAMQRQIREAKKREKESATADLTTLFAEVEQGLVRHGPTRVGVFDLTALGAQALRDLGDRVKSLGPDLAVGLFGREEGRVPYLVLCLGAARESGLEAGKLAKDLAALLGGGGGGRPDVAQGQGTKPDAVPAAIARLEGAFEVALRARGAGALD